MESLEDPHVYLYHLNESTETDALQDRDEGVFPFEREAAHVAVVEGASQ